MVLVSTSAMSFLDRKVFACSSFSDRPDPMKRQLFAWKENIKDAVPSQGLQHSRSLLQSTVVACVCLKFILFKNHKLDDIFQVGKYTIIYYK